MFGCSLNATANESSSCLKTALTQLEINQCANVGYKEADGELNRVYKKIKQVYKEDTVFLDKLKKAQLVWIQLLDADLELKYPHIDNHGYYGSILPMCMDQYKTSLILKRVAFLKQWLIGIEEGDVCAGSIMNQLNLQVGKADNELVIKENSFRGIKVGDKISSHSAYTKKDQMETGEGTFSIYLIKDFNDNPVGYFHPDPNNQNLVGDITIDTKNVETTEGIRVGSTFQELKNKFPKIKVYGSEIEGRTHATYDNLVYRLDIEHFSYEVDMKKIPLDTKIVSITINNQKVSVVCGIVTTNSDSLNIRKDLSKPAKVISKAVRGSALRILGIEGTWYKVKLNNGKTGYGSIDYIKELTPRSQEKCSIITTNGGSLNIRKKPNQHADIIGKAVKDSALRVMHISGMWYEILLNNGEVGYVNSDYVN